MRKAKDTEMLIVNNAIKKIDPVFYRRLSASYRLLGIHELKVCVMLRAGYNQAEILIYAGLTRKEFSSSIRKIKNIFKLESNSDLNNYLTNINFKGVKNGK